MNWYVKAMSSVNLQEQRAYEDLFDRVEDMKYRVLNDYLKKHPDQTTQPWHPISIREIFPIWRNYMMTKEVSSEDAFVLKELVDATIENIVKLYANTVLCGHTPEDPSEYFEDAGVDENDHRFYDWIENITDYALEPLCNDAIALLSTRDPEQWILIMDRVLDRVHQRSDLSKLFVEGGKFALDRLMQA